jgi:RNA binding exosome subunit
LFELPIAYVDIRFCVYATEDLDKVMEAVYNVLSIEHIRDIQFTRNDTEGHYGNPITFFETRINCKGIIKALIEKLAANLSLLDKQKLRKEMAKGFEKGSLFIRLDKQAALQGKFLFVIADPIRIRIRFRKSKLEDVTEICREIGILT